MPRIRTPAALLGLLLLWPAAAPAAHAQQPPVADTRAAVHAAPRSAPFAAAPRPITLRETLLRPAFGDHQLSPDGRSVLYTRTDRDEKEFNATSHIHLHDVASGRTIQLTNSARGESNPRWLPDGRVLFTSNRDGKAALWVISPAGGEAHRFIADADAPAGTLSPDRTRILYTEQSERPDLKEWEERVKRRDDGYFAEHRLGYTHVWVYDIATGRKTRLTAGEHDHTGPTWSPDGRWVAYTTNLNTASVRDAGFSNNLDIYLVPADSGAARQLTTNPGPDRAPVFSPDGRRVAYLGSTLVNSSADQMQAFVMALDGGEPVNLTADYDYSVSSIQWSSDGRSLYISTAEGLTQRLYRVPADGGRLVPVDLGADFVLGGFQMTENGRHWLVTGSRLAEPGIVYLTDADGRRPRRILHEHGSMAEFDLARAEPLTWRGADGWDIEGVLTYPLGYQPGQRYPLILQVHGGPHGRFSAAFNTNAQIWAARGYAVLQGNPRGSSGRTLEFSNANVNDWGGKDYIDVMNGVDHVISLGVADPDRLAIMGGSYGGFMTFWAVTQTDRFKAAIGHAGISDWYSFYGQTDIPNLLEFGFGGMPTNAPATYERWSPIRYAENVRTPLLITHGENDLRVPIAQAEQYFRTLKKLERTVEFLRYPRAGHGITEPLHRLHLDAEQERWFARHVK
jgi:dipeptidyl aminopeptidase/acylaminoacyl peptidase